MQSFPWPTPRPAWNLVPHWRTRMLPAMTCWPPYRLTPRRWPLESRPLRVDPCPFLCATDSSTLSRTAAASTGCCLEPAAGLRTRAEMLPKMEVRKDNRSVGCRQGLSICLGISNRRDSPGARWSPPKPGRTHATRNGQNTYNSSPPGRRGIRSTARATASRRRHRDRRHPASRRCGRGRSRG